jgi:hypothetical protein
MTQSIKDRIVELHAQDCRMAPKDIAAKVGCSVARVAQVYAEYDLRRYGAAPNVSNYREMSKSPSPFAVTGKPTHFEARRPDHSTCLYRDPRTAAYCGKETKGKAYCPECYPKTIPIGRARYSFSEYRRTGIGS